MCRRTRVLHPPSFPAGVATAPPPTRPALHVPSAPSRRPFLRIPSRQLTTRAPTRRAPKTEDMVAMYEFKLKLCPNKDPHDWTLCMWAHEGEVARRRNPSLHSGNPCVEFEKTQSCPRGDRCPYAHGVWERGLHPQRYRTSLCSNVAVGGKCNRKICFFAHGETTSPQSPRPGI